MLLALASAALTRERRARVDKAAELSHAYRGTALLLGSVIDADDGYTGYHSRGVVELAVAVADQLGLGDRVPPADGVRARCCTTSARSRCRRRSSTSPAR